VHVILFYNSKGKVNTFPFQGILRLVNKGRHNSIALLLPPFAKRHNFGRNKSHFEHGGFGLEHV
jgi:hypothetical protein